MKTKRSLTFNQIREATRVASAQVVWERAKRLSAMRHAMLAQGDRRAARLLGERKARCLAHAAALAPEHVHVSIDDDYLVGMLSVRWPGHGRLHLPPQRAELFTAS